MYCIFFICQIYGWQAWWSSKCLADPDSSTIDTGRCGTEMTCLFFLVSDGSTFLLSDFWCLFGWLICSSFTDPTVIVLLSEHDIERSYHLAQRCTLIICRKDTVNPHAPPPRVTLLCTILLLPTVYGRNPAPIGLTNHNENDGAPLSPHQAWWYNLWSWRHNDSCVMWCYVPLCRIWRWKWSQRQGEMDGDRLVRKASVVFFGICIYIYILVCI